MSSPWAIRPLVGAGPRLIVDQLIPRSAAATAIRQKRLFRSTTVVAATIPTTSKAPAQPSLSICWRCRHSPTSSRRQLRFSSSTSKPPNDDDKPRSPPSPSSELFAHLKPTSAADATDTSGSAPRKSSIDPSRPEHKPEQAHDEPAPQPPPPAPDHDLPSALNSRRSALNQSLSSFMDRAQTTLFVASQRMNHLTGYSAIESLKSQIPTLEAAQAAAQSHLTATRSAYKSAVSERATTQREVTALLARQKTWTPLDFERFTSLYRQDYDLDASVDTHATELEQAEREAERLNRELGAAILARYHEEQIWSDKIRRMSTWGTWGLMGVNILLFLLLQFGAEPWRRQRLVRGFEEKVREALAEERTAREATERRLALAVTAPAAAIPVPSSTSTTATFNVEENGISHEGEAEPVSLAASDVAGSDPDTTPAPSEGMESLQDDLPKPSWHEAYIDLNYWRLVLLDLISDRQIALRMRDVSLIAVEGLVTGATLVGIVAALLSRHA
ncbi:Mdm33 family-domain-containing protein [Astrocystis sublimbata]|nr:Mdm33 family-domain-containing protein [Astrocystis sublimbata]